MSLPALLSKTLRCLPRASILRTLRRQCATLTRPCAMTAITGPNLVNNVARVHRRGVHLMVSPASKSLLTDVLMLPAQNNLTIRFKSKKVKVNPRTNCPKSKGPRCSKENLKETACMQRKSGKLKGSKKGKKKGKKKDKKKCKKGKKGKKKGKKSKKGGKKGKKTKPAVKPPKEKHDERKRKAGICQKLKKGAKGKGAAKGKGKGKGKDKKKRVNTRSACQLHKEPKPGEGGRSMWKNPECCNDPCPDVLPRFDELYYKPSDKAKRKYQRTWAECPRLRVVRKPLCCFDKLKYPKLKKRKFAKDTDVACDMGKKQQGCQKQSNKKCKRIELPRCRGVRDPPKCKAERKPTDCTKACTPYPAFSECKKPKFRPVRPTECKCLQMISLCAAQRFQDEKIGKKK